MKTKYKLILSYWIWAIGFPWLVKWTYEGVSGQNIRAGDSMTIIMICIMIAAVASLITNFEVKD